MVSLLKNNLSDENAMNLPLENGHAKQVKYKRRSVSAVRDFPPGCGPNAPKVNIDTQERSQGEADLVVAEVAKVDRAEVVDGGTRVLASVRDFPPGCGAGPPRISDNPQGTTEAGIETGPVNTEVVEGSVANLEITETVDTITGVLTTVPDFPPGCGPGVPIITETEAETGPVDTGVVEGSAANLETSDMADGVMVVSTTGLQHLEIPLPEIAPELLKDTNKEEERIATGMDLSKGEAQASERQESGDNEVHPLVMEKESQEEKVKDQKCKEEEALHFANEELHKVQVSLEMDNICGQELELRIEGKPGVMDPLGSEKSTPLPIRDVAVPVNISSKNKYTPRKVSAIRDFPPFCGRNAPVPTEEDRARINYGKKSSSVVRKDGTKSVVQQDVMKNVHESNQKSLVAIPESSDDNAGLVENECNKTSVFSPKETRNKNMSLVAVDQEGGSDRVIVQALMAVSCDPSSLKGPLTSSKEIVVYEADGSPSRNMSTDVLDLGGDLDMVASGHLEKGKGTLTSPDNFMIKSRGRKRNFSGVEKSKYGETKTTKSSRKPKKLLSVQKDGYRGLFDSIMKEDGDFVAQRGDEIEDSPAGQAPRDFEVTLPPFGPNRSHDARNKVREALRLFQAVCRKILQGEEARSRSGEQSKSKAKSIRRIDLTAAKIVKEKGKEVNTDKQILGAVPGVEVGDEFQYRVELAIVGIHRLYQAGIDYVRLQDNTILAASIVASGGYADELDNSDVLIYSGQGGFGTGKDKQHEDQKLERGNLSLKNSIKAKNRVRVIRGSKETKASESADARSKIVMTYVYDGLYTVERYWQEVGPHGKLVFKFELRRLPGQPELAWKEVKKSKKSQIREGLCADDISAGEEIMPICAVNTIDDDKPPAFTYVTRMIYPNHCNLSLARGCDCRGGCLDSKKCLCAAKNGEIPYNFNGAIVEVKPLVYECGPACKCPPSCYNRVSQHGIKFQLEIFKTESRGWGVRSLNSIPAGSFICEYTGELLEDREAEQRTGNDEYLFDIGQNYNDCSQNPEANSSNLMEDGGFTIDAARCGNVGRFINHSCSPNLYAQNVLYDHDDKRMPHIMFFAAENIPPLHELTYHYNYAVDQVYDSNGEIKKKVCYCGSAECSGRMY